MAQDVELNNGIREAAKTEIRRREWASRRGIATRAFLREHPEVAEEFNSSATISVTTFPTHVTKASVLLELRLRAKRKEETVAVRQWREEHPEEAAAIEKEVRETYEREQREQSHNSKEE